MAHSWRTSGALDGALAAAIRRTVLSPHPHSIAICRLLLPPAPSAAITRSRWLSGGVGGGLAAEAEAQAQARADLHLILIDEKAGVGLDLEYRVDDRSYMFARDEDPHVAIVAGKVGRARRSA